MRVVVTGGAGRLGRSVVDDLGAAGHEVTVVDVVRPVNPGPRPAAARWVIADLSDAGAVFDVIGTSRPQVVVHLAGLATPFAHPEHVLFSVNTTLAYQVCQAALVARAETVICASSPTVIGYGNPRGWTPRRLPIDEEHPVAPWHAYAASKVAIEAAVRSFACQAGDDLRLFAVRPCYVVAPEEWRRDSVTQQGHTMHERIADPALAAPSLFNYVDSRDAASCIRALAERSSAVPNGATFFVGAADALTDRPVAEVLGLYHPGTVPLLDGLDPARSLFDIGKARRLLGWAPERSWRTELS
jgi:UDP-glucose 4-epimerase